LEIAGMRNQLVRRAVDLKKNISGNHRFLDILREMSSVVTENKMFKLNQSVDLNTQRLCQLSDSNERTAGSLSILQMVIVGIFAFEILDRLTGQWSVANSPWFATFYTSAIQDSPLLWFFISLLGWALGSLIIYYVYTRGHFVKQGLTVVRLKMNRKIFVDRLRSFLLAKLHSTEEHQYDDFNDIVKITYMDNLQKDWGGSKPIICFEYDERNCFLFAVTITYNRRKAKQALVFTADELKSKIIEELNLMEVWLLIVVVVLTKS
jgi:WD repeat-containing protein 35